MQKDEEKVVDAELASILKTSRFKQYFSITDAPDATPETKDPVGLIIELRAFCLFFSLFWFVSWGEGNHFLFYLPP